MTSPVRPTWILLYGQDCAERLCALADVAGEDAVHRFLSGKLRASPDGGLYVRQALDRESGRSTVYRLLDQLLQGQVVPVISPAAGLVRSRYRPGGMQLLGRLLVDVTDRSDSPADAPPGGARRAV